jgi:hypothetical protein
MIKTDSLHIKKKMLRNNEPIFNTLTDQQREEKLIALPSNILKRRASMVSLD